MGCFWSCEASPERCFRCRRKVVNNLRIEDGLCEVCVAGSRGQLQPAPVRPRLLYGEYKCTCGRFWSSRLSWPNYYQICKKCRKHVFAHNQRALRPSDKTNTRDNVQEHCKELCQMCQQLGRYCGNFGQRQTQIKFY